MKTVVQRWLMVFVAFVMVALVALSGCTDAGASQDVVEPQHSRLEETTNRASYRDVTVYTRSVLPASAAPVQRRSPQSQRLQSLEQAQSARRALARW